MSIKNSRNVVIFGLDTGSCADAIRLLIDKNIIDVKAWFGSGQYCTHDIYSFYTGDFRSGKYHGKGRKEYREIFEKTIFQFIDMMARHSFYSQRSVYDFINIFNIYYDYFFNLLIENKINTIIFSNLPHEGADLLVYSMAKQLNIPTIMFYQTLFPEKFFYLYNIEDFGVFNEIKDIHEYEPVKIENKFEKDHFYMSNINSINYELFSLRRTSLFLSLFAIVFRKKTYKTIENFIYRYFRFNAQGATSVNSSKKGQTSSIRKMISFIRDISSRSISIIKQFFHRYSDHREAQKNLARITSRQVDLNKSYIYFPLQLQPELTTSILGGMYVDQLLAIERLSKIIPEDWFIYIKENPKQTELMRGKWFFERLRSIEKVRVVPISFNTYTLLKNCVFLATITGTAGWEAITGGKNALVFGNPWYRNLPGVFSYHEDFNLNDILNYKINHDELERKFNSLLSKTECGVIDLDYSVIVKDYNDSNNINKITNVLERILLSDQK